MPEDPLSPLGCRIRASSLSSTPNQIELSLAVILSCKHFDCRTNFLIFAMSAGTSSEAGHNVASKKIKATPMWHLVNPAERSLIRSLLSCNLLPFLDSLELDSVLPHPPLQLFCLNLFITHILLGYVITPYVINFNIRTVVKCIVTNYQCNSIQ
nr:hypothetical protein Iba_chr08cCG1490 [Ipomoea batatas]